MDLNKRRLRFEHASNYPGTRQLCCQCEDPTGRCEEDELCVLDENGNELGPLCEACYDLLNNSIDT